MSREHLFANARQTHAQRLYALEQLDRTLRARQTRDAIHRHRIKDELLTLRITLSAQDAEQYKRLVFLKEGRDA